MGKLEQLRRFLDQRPTDLFCRHALAMELIKLGDDQAARRELEMVLELDAGYLGSYYHLGKLLERMGEEGAAATRYRRGIEEAVRQADRQAEGELRTALSLIED